MNGTEEMQAQQPPKGTGNPNVADVIIKQLQLWGVKRIYGVIGDAIFGLWTVSPARETWSGLA